MRDHGIRFQIFADFDLLLKELFLIHCFFVFRRGRDESRLGLRNWLQRLGQKCFLLLPHARFFEISVKPDFWTSFI